MEEAMTIKIILLEIRYEEIINQSMKPTMNFPQTHA